MTARGEQLAQEARRDQAFSVGVLIRFEGEITPMTTQYFFRKLDVARGRGADLIILEIDSPGGFLDDSLIMAEHLRNLDWAHTVAYIPREALSGAAIVALGCDEIVIDPKAVFGDAGPIFQGEDALFHHVPEKIRSHLARRVRDLATAKGRPPALAEAMVDHNLVVHRVRDVESGDETFMADYEIEDDADPDRWEKIKPVAESREGLFLEVNGDRAVELQLAEANLGSREELRRRYQLRKELIVLRPGSVDTAVFLLNTSLVTGVLLVIGMVALYFEFSAPGIGIGGLISGLCFAIFFWSRFLGGTAAWLEVVLFAAGVMFLLVELFVLPGFGFAGFTGFLLLLASLILAGQTFVVPSTARELSTLSNTMLVIVVSSSLFLVSAVMISRHFGTIPMLSRLMLQPPTAEELLAKGDGSSRSAPTHHSGAVLGDVGIADSPLRPAGKARFGNNYVDVVTDGKLVAEGAQVEVVQIGGNRVVVREVEKVK